MKFFRAIGFIGWIILPSGWVFAFTLAACLLVERSNNARLAAGVVEATEQAEVSANQLRADATAFREANRLELASAAALANCTARLQKASGI